MFTGLSSGIYHFILFLTPTQLPLGGPAGSTANTVLSLLFMSVGVYLRAARADVYTESMMQDIEGAAPSFLPPSLLRLNALNSYLLIPLVII